MLSRFRVHERAPWGDGYHGPALLAPMVLADGDPVDALAILPLHPDCERFSAFLGPCDGRVVCLTPLADRRLPLLVTLDLQDAWRLATDAAATDEPCRAVIAPRLSTFAGGALGDRWGRVVPEAPAADPAAPPWRSSGEDAVYLAMRGGLRTPPLRVRALTGGTRERVLEGDEASAFFGAVALQHWRRTDGHFQAANAVRLLRPAGARGFNEYRGVTRG